MRASPRVDLTEVTEGNTRILAPTHQAQSGAGPKQAGPAFYNPAMALTRDITVLAAQTEPPPERPTFLDGLTATGIRGLRVANETTGWHVTLNDRSRKTAKIAKRNLDNLDLTQRVIVRRQDLNHLLATERFAFIDIDPYGSPIPFLCLAVRAVHDDGILALTATDTTALHGVKPKPAKRRYGGHPPPRNVPGWKAAASRYLLAAITKEAARHDRHIHPLLVHHHQHALRAYVRIHQGAREADQALQNLSTIALCPRCYAWGDEACPCGETPPTGPYHVGPIHDASFLAAMQAAQEDATLAHPNQARTLLDHLQDETRLGPFYMDVDRAVKAHNLGGPPARERLQEALANAGIDSARTHYGPTTLAHDGDPEAVLAVLDDLTG